MEEKYELLETVETGEITGPEEHLAFKDLAPGTDYLILLYHDGEAEDVTDAYATELHFKTLGSGGGGPPPAPKPEPVPNPEEDQGPAPEPEPEPEPEPVPQMFTVTFVDEDGTVLKEATQYPYGTKAVNIAKPDDPVKPSTAQYEYTFTGWDPAIADVTADAVYTAAYSAALRRYTITFVNEDNTVLQSGLLDYGAMPVYHGEVPAKPADVSHSYHFAGWDPEIVSVTASTKYRLFHGTTTRILTHHR